jgi:hypothetical protein
MFSKIKAGSREHLEFIARDILMDKPVEDWVDEKIENMSNVALKEFVEKYQK